MAFVEFKKKEDPIAVGFGGGNDGKEKFAELTSPSSIKVLTEETTSVKVPENFHKFDKEEYDAWIEEIRHTVDVTYTGQDSLF